ncbi:hypothetical protein LguiA_025587 [Lonicera macranthoides]
MEGLCICGKWKQSNLRRIREIEIAINYLEPPGSHSNRLVQVVISVYMINGGSQADIGVLKIVTLFMRPLSLSLTLTRFVTNGDLEKLLCSKYCHGQLESMKYGHSLEGHVSGPTLVGHSDIISDT